MVYNAKEEILRAMFLPFLENSENLQIVLGSLVPPLTLELNNFNKFCDFSNFLHFGKIAEIADFAGHPSTFSNT